jgi:chemotaxis protein CheY-P-specific phosphatase CheC
METSLQKRISEVMNKGFRRAANSFSQMINRPISIPNSGTVIIQGVRDFIYTPQDEGKVMVLTTGMIGEMRGKSFLILSEDEQKEICQAVSPSQTLSVEYQQALLLEIDNIVSASVISQLANDFNLQIYGDVPMLKLMESDDIKKYLCEGMENENSYSIILCKTTFLIGSQKHIHPQFIWKIGPEFFDLIEHSFVKQ